MSVDLVRSRSARRSARRARGWWVWLALTSVAIAVFAPLPYLTNSLSSLAGEGGGLAGNYVSRPAGIQAALYVHMVAGGIALGLSPLQLIARVRARVPRLHRVVGRVVILAMVVGGLSGMVLATVNAAGAVGTAGFGLLGALWVVFPVLGFLAIRRGDVATHRRWMVRGFALTYAAVMLRLWLGVLMGAQGLAGVPDGVAFERAYAIVPFLCWVPNLVVAEWYLRRRGNGGVA
ncbi:DUF2306 domain-containing protein [Myceligenerans sp. TRM 65318]|uniref:DUF2306 domain-containing protein n=1 Tax=Myceligenerans pegani TaxID=2776917 RepID=A0ABR9MVR6_9MICO|nr:DUF2306 domain-containing protein [Myceligenerans sp. TRM 65318]MBE3017746.1 DUF2306 domain-containing protein [Myceligenerans sp. TRM 65318]